MDNVLKPRGRQIIHRHQWSASAATQAFGLSGMGQKRKIRDKHPMADLRLERTFVHSPQPRLIQVHLASPI